MLSDLEAIKAIDRLCAVSRNLDHIGLRDWIAAHCGLNPHAAKPLDPDAAIVAERDNIRATVGALRDKADRLAARLQDLESRNRELKDKLAGAKNDAKGNAPSGYKRLNPSIMTRNRQRISGKPRAKHTNAS
jgi:hypothetical protein